MRLNVPDEPGSCNLHTQSVALRPCGEVHEKGSTRHTNRAAHNRIEYLSDIKAHTNTWIAASTRATENSAQLFIFTPGGISLERKRSRLRMFATSFVYEEPRASDVDPLCVCFGSLPSKTSSDKERTKYGWLRRVIGIARMIHRINGS